MFAFFRKPKSTSGPRRATAGSMELQPDTDGYVTDGTELYRIVDGFPVSPAAVVGLENCRSLELVLVTVEDFAALALRPVRPDHTDAAYWTDPSELVRSV
jgi:hypothetical protein